MLCMLCWLTVAGGGCVVPLLLIVVSPENGDSGKVILIVTL